MDKPPSGENSGYSPLASPTFNNLVGRDESLDIIEKIRTLLGDDYKFISVLGTGAGGQVLLCQYTGTNDEIKGLCDVQNHIAVKLPSPHIDLMEESRIAQLLKNYSISGVNIGLPVIKDNQCIATLLQFVSYRASPSGPEADSVKSFFRKFYKNIVANNLSKYEHVDFIVNALSTDIGVIFAQLINDMQQCQFKLHKLRMLHLDTGSRNFLLQAPMCDLKDNFIKFPLVICDYGHSALVQMDETVNVSLVQGKPSTSRDARAVNNDIATIRTDIFALKCTLLGMVSMAIANLEFDTNILSISQSDTANFKDLRKYIPCFQNDTYVLAAYLKNLCDHLKLCPDENIRDQTRLFIKIYSNYVCTMPPDTTDIKTAHNFDRKLLLDTNVEFFQTLVRQCVNSLYKVEDNKKFEDFLLTISRLLTLPVTEDFKNTSLFKRCTELTDVSMVKEFAEKYFDPMQVLNMPSLDMKFPIAGEPIHMYWIIAVNKQRKKWFDELPSDIETDDIKAEFNQQTLKLISFISQGKYNSAEPISGILFKILKKANEQIKERQSNSSREESDKEEDRTPSPPSNTGNLEGHGQELTRSNFSKNK